MSQYTLRQVLRYRFDNFMAKGGRSIFITLVVVFLTFLGTISLIRGAMLLTIPDGQAQAYLEREDASLLNNIYIVFLQMTDPGNMNQDVKSSPLFKVSAIAAGLTGVIMLSSLIAFITSALDQKLLELKKGHSKVVETGHTLILGWNERVIEILRELVFANESEDDPSAVILSDEDKETMDDFLKVHLRRRENTRVVTRSGSVSSLVNLGIVSVDASKSVIVLATCSGEATAIEKQASDATVIKTVLAVMASHTEDTEFSIVAEVFDDRNRKIVEGVAPDNIATIDSNDILSKILVQTSRSVGLSVVYSEILSFDGCEMYFHHDDWSGLTFGELGFHFPDGAVMGLRHADGKIVINPPIETALADDDDILILAEDDSTIDFQGSPVATAREFDLSGERLEQTIERELIIGWTPKVEIILQQYADYVLDGSTVDIVLRAPDDSVRGEIERIQEELTGLEINLIDQDPLTTEGLLAVKPFNYDNIIILSQPGAGATEEQTDSETIVILLLLRNIFKAYPEELKNTKLITEVLDSDNQGLVAQAGVNDFVISNRYISMMLAQISEDIQIERVYDDLFQEDGCEIYLKPASYYFQEFPIEVTFADIMRIAQKREEIALGIKIKSAERDMDANFGVRLIPEKNSKHILQRDDSIVVVAEDET